MGRQEYLIDSNVAIEYIGAALPEKALTMPDGIIDGQFYISVINKIELLGFADITKKHSTAPTTSSTITKMAIFTK